VVPISLQHITKSYGPVRALDDVCLDVQAGELFFLLGPSGCGKTTLLRTIAGFCTPDGGRVLLGDRDVTALAPRRRQTGMVFQNYALWPHMTVEANVAFGLTVRHVPRRERRQRVAAALELVRMAAYARRRPHQLSGGQQQRVALARALVVRPQCLLLDEPLSNLDAKLRLEMRGEIRRVCREAGLTALYVTHDQKEALSIADRLAVLFEGRIGQIGTPRELYRQPARAAVADFLGETNFLEATILAGDGEGRRLTTAVGELRAVAPAAPRTGSCIISIRPEAIVVRPAGQAAPSAGSSEGSPLENRFTARVVSGTYLGEGVQLTLASGALTLRATRVESAAQAPLPPGVAVECGVDARDVVILPT
jgi:iron(III) transport system ATP-binding protein